MITTRMIKNNDVNNDNDNDDDDDVDDNDDNNINYVILWKKCVQSIYLLINI